MVDKSFIGKDLRGMNLQRYEEVEAMRAAYKLKLAEENVREYSPSSIDN